MTAPVDVVVVAYHAGARLAGCLRSVQGLGGEVVVVDHGDGADAAAAQAWGARPVVDPTNPGFGAGQNRGVAMVTAPYVLLCNPDAEVDAAAVRAGVHLLEREPGVAAVQGRIERAADGGVERSQGRELRPVDLIGRAMGAGRIVTRPPLAGLARRVGVLAVHVDRVPPGPVAVENLAATALLVRRRAFEDVGGFDPSYFLYGEDLDLCRRLREAGWTLTAVPDAWAVHEGGASSPSSPAREVEWWRGTMTYAARWWGTPAWTAAVAASVVAWARVAVRVRRGAGRAWRSMVAEPFVSRRRGPGRA